MPEGGTIPDDFRNLAYCHAIERCTAHGEVAYLDRLDGGAAKPHCEGRADALDLPDWSSTVKLGPSSLLDRHDSAAAHQHGILQVLDEHAKLLVALDLCVAADPATADDLAVTAGLDHLLLT